MPHFGLNQDPQGEFKALLTLLKKTLKERKISYASLAEQMGLSESGIKKILTSEDLSYRRISQIAAVLGLRLSDLLNEIENEETHSVVFSNEEQKYFLDHPEAFHVFIRLVIERYEVEEVQSELKLNQAALFKILKKLDSFGWLQLLPENKIKLPPLSMVQDFGAGPLLEKIYQKWGAEAVKGIAKPANQKTGRFIVRALRMKPSTYQDFLNKLKDLEMELLKTALREMNVSTKGLANMRWISLTDDSSFLPHPSKGLTNVSE